MFFSRVAEYEQDNKMTKINLASIFGPVLMNPEKVCFTFSHNMLPRLLCQASADSQIEGKINFDLGQWSEFGSTQQEISVIL